MRVSSSGPKRSPTKPIGMTDRLSPSPIPSLSSSFSSLFVRATGGAVAGVAKGASSPSPLRNALSTSSLHAGKPTNTLFAAAAAAASITATAARATRFSWMDFITSFDIRLEKDVYYAGEPVVGCVVLENSEPIKMRGVRVFLRGRARAQWKVLKSGESRTLKDDQYLLDEKYVIWGKDKHDDPDAMQILPKGLHQFNFTFQLPQCQLPCSLETKAGTIRYYVKVIIDIPYASSPQGIKYFTFVGPHIDCMEEKFLSPLTAQDHKIQCFRCCQRGTIALRVVLERTAYCCGENLRMKAQIENHQDCTISLCTRLYQHIEYRIDRGVAETKNVVSMVLEHRSPSVAENTRAKFDTHPDHPVKLPVVPPTMVGVCRLMQIYYILKVCVEDERKNEWLEMDFPLTIATVPHRSTHSQVYSVTYDFCVDWIETGKYISTEFRLGHVYDGENGNSEDIEDIILYRPVYVRTVDKVRNLDRISKEILDSPLSVRGIQYREGGGSQKSTTSTLHNISECANLPVASSPNPPAMPVVQTAANGDISPRANGATFEDCANEAINLY